MSKKELRVWETVSKRTILHHNKFLTVENRTVKIPDGQIISDWAWIIIPSEAAYLLMRWIIPFHESAFLAVHPNMHRVFSQLSTLKAEESLWDVSHLPV